MTKELVKAISEYEQVFNDGFPTIPLAVSTPPDEVISIIRECLEKKRMYMILAICLWMMALCTNEKRTFEN